MNYRLFTAGRIFLLSLLAVLSVAACGQQGGNDMSGNESTELTDAGSSGAAISELQIIDVTQTTYTIQLSGDSEKLTAFIEAVGESVILEVVRTGVSGISRGEKVLKL